MTAASEPVLLRQPTPWGVRLVLNRPAKLNAISTELREALAAAIEEAAADERVRVVVVEGAGRAFCAGYDLAEGQPGDAWGWREVLGEDVAATLAVWRCPKPVIAQVHGYCLAGGLELAMACDLVVAAEDAQLGEPEIRFGSAPVTLLMPYLVGQKKTRELLPHRRPRRRHARRPASAWSTAPCRPSAWRTRSTPWPTSSPGSSPTSWPRPSSCSTGRWRRPASWRRSRWGSTSSPSST